MMNWRPRFLRIAALLTLFAAATSSAPGAGTDYLAQALPKFHSEAPAGWAYTLTTTRDGATSVERFDPSAPPAEQWTLLSRNGATPSAEDTEHYRRYKATVAPTGMRATFTRGDIDSASAQLVRETADEVEYLCRFREDLADVMLSRLALTLVVDKRSTAISSFHFRLIQPFSPALGVKMQTLDVRMTFSPPAGDRPALPLTASSHFKGRLLFVKSVEENLAITYSDFRPPPTRE